MAHIACNSGAIHRMTGLDIKNSLLYPHMDLDSTEFSSPVMVQAGDGTRYLLVKDIERGNFDEGNISAEIRYFKPYVTFDRDAAPLPSDWIELVRQIVDGQATVDDDFYTSGYWKLADAVDVRLKPTGRWDRTFVYSVGREKIVEEFAAGNCTAVEGALRLIKGLGHEKELENLLQNLPEDSRFTKLDALLKEVGAESLLLSSPLCVQEVSAIPLQFLTANETIALYSPGRPVFIFTRNALPFSFCNLEAVYPTLSSAAAAISQYKGSVGFEENHLPYKYFVEFGLNRGTAVNMSTWLRTWRECLAVGDLPFYIIAAQVTRYGMEQAIQRAGDDINSGKDITESKVQEYLYRAFTEYQLVNNLPCNISPYFIVLVAGHNTRKPNLPGFKALGKETRSLKIDAGVTVRDKKGLHRAASDLCRTLTIGKEAGELYDFMEKVMLTRAIPAILPGRTGEQVYWDGVNDLMARELDWVEMGLLPEGYDLAANYNRNIGHSMGKQEPSALGFEKSCLLTVQEGMVCALEYQWPYHPYCIGIEDMVAVTARGPLNITR